MSIRRNQAEMIKHANIIKKIFGAISKGKGALQKAEALAKPKILSKELPHVSVPELKQSLLKVENLEEALKKHKNLHELVGEEIKAIDPNLKDIYKKHTRFVIYDPAHPFDIHTVSTEDIKSLAETNPEYLKKTLHVYTPRDISLTHNELDKIVFPQKFSLFGPPEVIVKGTRFTKPVAVVEGFKGYVEITPQNLAKIKELAKRHGASIRIVEAGETPFGHIGTLKGVFLTGFRPLETTYHRYRYGGLPSVLTSAWSLSPATKMYLEKIKAGRFAEIPFGDHLSAGLMDIGLGRILPLYLGTSALASAMSPSTSAEERKNKLKFSLFNLLSPIMYPFSIPVWSLYGKMFDVSPDSAIGRGQEAGAERDINYEAGGGEESPLPVGEYYGDIVY
ncbi:MAG: hypothetical protein ABIM30_00285 [candidate division WOR-3 bacterium]